MRRISIIATSMTLVLFGMLGSGGVAGANGATAAPAVPPGTTPDNVQPFEAAGSGTVSEQPSGALVYDGGYISSSQLGYGRFHVETDAADAIGTARFTRFDGTAFSGGITVDPNCSPGCVIVTLSGSTEITAASFYMGVQRDTPSAKTITVDMQGDLTLAPRIGYLMVDTNSVGYGFGGISDAPGGLGPAVAVALSSAGNSFWTVDGAGTVKAHNRVSVFNGGPAETLAVGEQVTSISATPTDKGYWLFTSAGRVLPFGDAKFLGDLRGRTLNGSVVGSVATPTGKGYYMVGSDGGVFAFGDARFHGSTGSLHLNQPVVGLVPNAGNTGYWLVASDGGVFSFDAPFLGSMGAVPLNRPIVSMVRYDGGYMMVGSDGGVFNFSKGLFFGSLGGTHVPEPVVAAAAIG